MSNAWRCDRCGGYYVNDEYPIRAYGCDVFKRLMLNDGFNRNKILDLCPNCKEDFKKWFWPSKLIKEDNDNVSD